MREEIERLYKIYKREVGGEPIILTVPYGYPEGINDEDDVVEMYKYCIENKVKWEDVLDVKETPEDAII